MKVQVTLTRTDTGATTKIRSDSGESSKEYSSWNDALIDAEHIGLINEVESTAAKALPPGFPLHTNAELDLSVLGNQGLCSREDTASTIISSVPFSLDANQRHA
jgi:hypothetical protein